ncbi:hypothetical protein R1flu_028144 [Riccia fluitans]|uniref:Uncharacterized protein n=1 Tax=Riccia fluitans TaxID=41844 RepID=A0ABD1XNP1_9MARC
MKSLLDPRESLRLIFLTFWEPSEENRELTFIRESRMNWLVTFACLLESSKVLSLDLCSSSRFPHFRS